MPTPLSTASVVWHEVNKERIYERAGRGGPGAEYGTNKLIYIEDTYLSQSHVGTHMTAGPYRHQGLHSTKPDRFTLTIPSGLPWISHNALCSYLQLFSSMNAAMADDTAPGFWRGQGGISIFGRSQYSLTYVSQWRRSISFLFPLPRPRTTRATCSRNRI